MKHAALGFASILLIFAIQLLLNGCLSESSGSAAVGQAGSMARFTIVDNYLYTLAGSSLQVYDLADSTTPVFKKGVYVGWDIETLFSDSENLYIGAADLVYIYNIENPENPVQQSHFGHFRSCDPVVVKGNIAYVTLSSGERCWAGRNQLEILDVSDKESPRLLNTIPMANPQGLGVDGNLLFICDGHAGLKVYEIVDDSTINLVQTISEVNTYDVIPRNGLLVLITEDGVYQYDYTETPVSLLSKIDINSEGPSGKILRLQSNIALQHLTRTAAINGNSGTIGN